MSPPAPPRLLVAALAAALAASSTSSRAHVGAVVARATFCAPPALEPTEAPDGGVRYTLDIAEADAFYPLAWLDGDNDPTGKFTFYYFDRQLPAGVDTAFVEKSGAIVKARDGREARDVFVSCACGHEDAGASPCNPPDAGTLCTDLDGGAAGGRWCDDRIAWDTSAVPDGVYWLAAVNNDPPFYVYNMSQTPVRVRHGAAQRPAVIVLRPDGLGPGADTSYGVEVLIRGGRAPYTIDLAYGVNEAGQVQKPLRGIVDAAPVTLDDSGVFSYTWDVSALPSGVYFVSATVTDADGLKTTSASRYSVSVYRRMSGGLADLAVRRGDGRLLDVPDAGPSCACDLGARGARPATPLHWLSLAGLALLARRRTRSR